MDLKGCAHAFLRGISDSFRGSLTLFYLDREMNNRMLSRLSPTRTNSSTPIRNLRQHEKSKVLPLILQCCALNGGFFLCSIWLFEFGFLPSVSFILSLIYKTDLATKESFFSLAEPILTFIFQVVWAMPLFGLTRIVNSLWFQDIADSAYRYSRGRPQFIQSVSLLLADFILSFGVQLLFFFQAMLVSYIPIYMLGHILSLIHMCLLYALYAFEYKWFNMGWELHKRLTYIENNWPYFIGFGLPLAVLSDLSNSWFVNAGIFAILFPLFILSAHSANPVTGVCDYPLHLFSPVIILTNAVLNKTLTQGPQPTSGTASSSRR